ncbi:hypothetical protein HPB50_002839 [Hyalomma asiaticum]|uniref:Uncharacterized protein n=1 Tax=Hyalomma asiaticum TaxID=266040 RepID=A0ACB7SDV9_HYAAI|nr:hypothetical protein HPB50_002839 [Hyalomma asiaticum]
MEGNAAKNAGSSTNTLVDGLTAVVELNRSAKYSSQFQRSEFCNALIGVTFRTKSTKKLESSGAALTQSVELMLDVQERFATVPNGPVADRVTAKLKAVLDKNPGFYVLKQVSNVLSGADSKIPGVPTRYTSIAPIAAAAVLVDRTLPEASPYDLTALYSVRAPE